MEALTDPVPEVFERPDILLRGISAVDKPANGNTVEELTSLIVANYRAARKRPA